MKILSIVFFGLITISHLAYNQALIFDEQFDDNLKSWPTGSRAGISLSLEKGMYKIMNYSNQAYVLDNKIVIPENSNYILECYYRNSATSNRNFGVIINGYPISVGDFGPKSTFDAKLKLVKNNQSVKIYINENYVEELEYVKPNESTDRVSIFVSQKEVVSLDYIKFSLTPSVGLPPNLFAELNYDDNNHNGILEAGEESKLIMKIINQGKGPAWELKVSLADSLNDSGLILGSINIPILFPDQFSEVEIPIAAKKSIKTDKHKLSINVNEYNGYDMDPAYLYINTYAYQYPNLVFSGLEIIDDGENNAAINQDYQLQAGELVTIKFSIQNSGQYIAKDVRYQIGSKDENIFIQDGQGFIGDFQIGQVKDFFVKVSPNKRVTSLDRLPIYLTLKDNVGDVNVVDYPLPVYLNQKPAEANILSVRSDVESLEKEVARFEYNSKKFTSQKKEVVNLKSISPSRTKRVNSVAVIMGIRNYKELPPAPYADNDASLMKEYFEKILGIEQVLVYINSEVSGFIFDDIFNPDNGELAKAIDKGETDVYFYYSGHGIPDKSGEYTYLFPYDGKTSRLEIQGYSTEKLYQSLHQLGAKSVTVILDSCFSGESRSSSQIKSENLVAQKGVKIKPNNNLYNYPEFTVISSSAAGETSLGYDASESGLFTYYLCLGLQGSADENSDKKITFGELRKFVIDNVTLSSKRISGLQTPEFFGKEDLILVSY